MTVRRVAFAFVLVAVLALHALAAPPAAPTPVTGKPVTTASGLQYYELKVGSGDVAAAGDIVKVHYTGWLTDGTRFDSSIGKDPLRFWLGKGVVIKGWDEGIVGMKVGGKRQLHIPSKLGYGAQGNANIPANSDLVFDVELVGVSK